MGVGVGWGVYWIHPVCLSVCLSICPLTFRVRPVASTAPDGLFPYLVQMINSMRECVACDDPWSWPISSRSFGLDLENRVRSVAYTVLDGFFYIWHKWSLSLVGVSRFTFFQDREIQIFGEFWNFTALTFKKNLQFLTDYFHTYHKWSLVWEGVLQIMTFDLDLYLQGHLALALKIVDLYLQGHLALALKIVSALYHLQFLMDSFHIW